MSCPVHSWYSLKSNFIYEFMAVEWSDGEKKSSYLAYVVDR